jgi:hypothetical protein
MVIHLDSALESASPLVSLSPSLSVLLSALPSLSV